MLAFLFVFLIVSYVTTVHDLWHSSAPYMSHPLVMSEKGVFHYRHYIWSILHLFNLSIS